MAGKKGDDDQADNLVEIRNIRKADPRRPNVNKITLDAGRELVAGEACMCGQSMALDLVELGYVEIL